MSHGTIITNSVASQAEVDFQEKMKERMRQAFGDLMPDAVLAGIVSRGIEEAFFKPQTRADGRWDSVKEYPSWMIEFIGKEVKEQVSKAVQKWMVENQDKVEGVLQKVLQDGMGSALVGAFNSMFQTEMYALRDGLSQSLRNLANR